MAILKTMLSKLRSQKSFSRGTATHTEEMSMIDHAIRKLLELRRRPPGVELQLPLEDLMRIAELSASIFLRQPMLLELSAPMNVMGDTHGQYSDLLRMLEVGGYPPQRNYLFLGDYVDRGRQGMETLALLLCFKIKFPENFFMLRGNHECSNINKMYGFYDECKRRYCVKLWKAFSHCFDCMPVAAILADRIFCCHGGISPHLKSMDDIRNIQRPLEVPATGLMCDLLWADPCYGEPQWGLSKR